MTEEEQKPEAPTKQTAKKAAVKRTGTLKNAAPDVQTQLDEIALESALLDLEEKRENNAIRKSQRDANSRKNRQRQAQLKIDRDTREAITKGCKHRQGGTPNKPYSGKGSTALNVATMPDGYTVLIMCSVCRLRKFSPHPSRMATGLRKGETPSQRDARVAQYYKDKEEFDALREQSRDALTEEAAQVMECGTTHTFISVETGNPVYRERPCDSYA